MIHEERRGLPSSYHTAGARAPSSTLLPAVSADTETTSVKNLANFAVTYSNSKGHTVKGIATESSGASQKGRLGIRENTKHSLEWHRVVVVGQRWPFLSVS